MIQQSSTQRSTQSGIEAPPVWQIDPARVKRIAVLCGPVLVTLDHASANETGTGVENVAGETLAGIIERAVVQHCGALWFLPVLGNEPRASYDAPWLVNWDDAARACIRLPERMPDYPLRFHELSQKNRIAGLVAQRKHGGMPLTVYAAWRDMWNVAGHLHELPSEPMQRARAFALGVRLAAYALGSQLRFSPSYTGLQLLRATLAHKPYELTPLSDEARELVMEHRPTYVQWCRDITPTEALTWTGRGGLLTIHKYDRNASFVASAGEVPVGDPVKTDVYVPGKPGFYQVRAWVMPEEIGAIPLPGPFHVGKGAGAYPTGIVDTWAWEPQIRQAIRQGVRLAIAQGYYWPQKHDVFRVWRDRIWQARRQADEYGGPVGAIARGIIKRVGVASIGRLIQQRGRAVMQTSEAQARELRVLSHEVDDYGDLTGTVEVEAPLGKIDLAQPHWWSTIIANANERQLAALYAHETSIPIGAYVDAVYSLAPWPPADIAPAQLGKWKLERQTVLDAAQVERLNLIARDTERDGAYTWVAQLARFAGERVEGSGDDDA